MNSGLSISTETASLKNRFLKNCHTVSDDKRVPVSSAGALFLWFDIYAEIDLLGQLSQNHLTIYWFTQVTGKISADITLKNQSIKNQNTKDNALAETVMIVCGKPQFLFRRLVPA